MSAQDYKICPACFNVFLAKVSKRNSNLMLEKDAAFILKYEDDDGVFTQIGDIFFKYLMKVGNALMYQDPE